MKGNLISPNATRTLLCLRHSFPDIWV